MSLVTLSILFRDTVDLEDAEAVSAKMSDLANRLLNAAESVKQRPTHIYSIVTVTRPWEYNEPQLTIETPIPSERTGAEINSELMLEGIFEKLKKTDKSQKLLKVFVENSGTDLTVEQLVNATGLDKLAVTNWLNQTAHKIKAITNPARGIYKLNPDKL